MATPDYQAYHAATWPSPLILGLDQQAAYEWYVGRLEFQATAAGDTITDATRSMWDRMARRLANLPQPPPTDPVTGAVLRQRERVAGVTRGVVRRGPIPIRAGQSVSVHHRTSRRPPRGRPIHSSYTAVIYRDDYNAGVPFVVERSEAINPPVSAQNINGSARAVFTTPGPAAWSVPGVFEWKRGNQGLSNPGALSLVWKVRPNCYLQLPYEMRISARQDSVPGFGTLTHAYHLSIHG